MHIQVKKSICTIDIEGQFHDMEEGKDIFKKMFDCLDKVIIKGEIKKLVLNLKIYDGNTGTFVVTLYKLFDKLDYWKNNYQIDIKIIFWVNNNNLDMIETAEDLEETIYSSNNKYTITIHKYQLFLEAIID